MADLQPPVAGPASARRGDAKKTSQDGSPGSSGASATGSDVEATVVIPRRPPPIEIGDILGHTYRVEALLGKGGMGIVYRARHIELASEHAIKVIVWELSSDPQIVALLNREAQILRSLKHDAVVEYQGLMLDEYGRRYLVMEFVDGPSLASELLRHQLSPGDVRRLRNRLASGLAAAHAKGIFHRDISPDNIILPGRRIENAKIIDFGIAKSTAAGDRTITGGDFAGKFSFASPEQAGMFDGKIDARSDIYSLGLLLASAAIGNGGKLDMGQSPSAVYEARQSVPGLSRVPPELRGEIAAMLQPNPADRPQTMEEVMALGAAQSGPRNTGSVKPGPRLGDPGLRPARRRSATIVAAAIGVAAMLGAGGIYRWYYGPAPLPAGHVSGEVNTPVPLQTAEKARESATPPVPDVPSAGTVDSSSQTPPHDNAPSPPSPAPAQSEPVTIAPSPPASTTVALAPVMTAERRKTIELQIKQTLKGYQCAAVTSDVGDDGRVELDGLLSSEDDLAVLQQATAGIPGVLLSNHVAVSGATQCEAASLLRNTATSVNQPPGPLLRFNHSNRTYRGEDILIVDATATPQFSGYLYVDYFDADGNVVHMLPTPPHAKNAMKAGETVTLGAPKEGGKTGARVYEISEPFGPALVTAISSPKPLFPPRVQEMESATSYLAVLNRALKAATAGPDSAVVGSYALVNTVAK
jgi:serine/threonine protein kinase